MNKRNRYGCVWPDGSETGPITDSWRLAANYAKNPGVDGITGKVKDYDSGATSDADQPTEGDSSP